MAIVFPEVLHEGWRIEINGSAKKLRVFVFGYPRIVQFMSWPQYISNFDVRNSCKQESTMVAISAVILQKVCFVTGTKGKTKKNLEKISGERP